MTSNKFSWAHLLTTVLGVVVTVVSPAARGFIGGHPYLSTVLVGVFNVLGVFLTPPTAPTGAALHITRVMLFTQCMLWLVFAAVLMHAAWLF